MGEGSRQQPNDRKKRGGPNQQQKGARRPRKKHLRPRRQTRRHSQANCQSGATREKAKHKTKGTERQGKHSPDRDRTQSPHLTKCSNKNGGATRGHNPTEARKKIPTTPQQVGTIHNAAPKEKGHSETKRENDNRTEGRGEGRGGSLRQTPCSIFKVVLLICAESVIPAIPYRKGDRISSLFPCGQEPQFIAFGLKGNPVSLLRSPA